MNIVKSFIGCAAVLLSVASASPCVAACIQGPYASVPPVTYSGSVNASQNTTLYPDSTIYSPNGVYKLIFQEDGNLVEYKNNTQAVWDINATNCIPTPYMAYRTRFQPDGNLVVYWALQSNPTQEIAIWDTNTQGHPNARLAVQDDGNVVIYNGTKAIWARTW